MLTELIDATAALMERSDSSEAHWYAPRLRTLRDGAVVTEPNALPLAAGIPDVGCAGSNEAAAVAACIPNVADELTWFRSSTARVPSGWAHQAGASEVVGPKGMIVDPDFRFGVFVLEADTHYPWHWHAAQELYLVVAGQVEFQLEGTAPVTCRADGFFETP